MRWYEHPPILDYVVSCYAGVDEGRRQFIWEEPSGDVVIGNARAFTDHVCERFGLEKTATAWTSLHELLRALGEVAQVHERHGQRVGMRFRNQQPHARVIKRRE